MPNKSMLARTMPVVVLLLFNLYPSAAFAVELTQNAPREPVRQHKGSIAGAVVDASGKPVAHATVKLTDSVTQEIQTYKSDKHGKYKIINLFPGGYTLQAEVDGRQSDIRQVKVSNDPVINQDLKLGPRK